MPPATVDVFRNHGKVAATLEQNLPEAHHILQQVRNAGIDLERAMQELQDEGVASFVKSFKNLSAALVKKY